MAEPRRRHLYLLINTPRSRSSTKKNRLTNHFSSHSLQVMAGKITNLLFSLFSRTKCVIIFKIFILSIYLFLQSGKGIFSPPTVKQISPVNNFFSSVSLFVCERGCSFRISATKTTLLFHFYLTSNNSILYNPSFIFPADVSVSGISFSPKKGYQSNIIFYLSLTLRFGCFSAVDISAVFFFETKKAKNICLRLGGG